jgi:hypothetical protein
LELKMIEYRIDTNTPAQPVEEHHEGGQGMVRPALWVLVAVTVVGQAVTSFTGSTILHAALGAVTAVSAIGLITSYLRRR